MLDLDAARELELFAENTGELYPQKQAILKNLRLKRKADARLLNAMKAANEAVSFAAELVNK
jgi:hypothetical protein